MSTSTEMKPSMPQDLLKKSAKLYSNQHQLLGYKKVANLIKAQYPQYSVSTKRLKEFFAIKENILPSHILAVDSPVAKKNILKSKLRKRKVSTLKPRKTPLKSRTNITTFKANGEDEDYNPAEDEENMSEIDTDNEIDDNVNEEMVSEPQVDISIDMAEVQAVKNVVTKKKKKNQGKSAKKKSNRKKKMKAKLKKLKNNSIKKSLCMDGKMSCYAIDDERLYDDIVLEVDLTAEFLGL